MHLFTIKYKAKKLSEEMTQLFHYVVAKLLYLSRITHKTYNCIDSRVLTRVITRN